MHLQMYAGYDEIEIGPLDCDEIEGHIPGNAEILLQFADEFEKQNKREQLDKDTTIYLYGKQDFEDENEDEFETYEAPPKENWDCESHLSMLSNKFNHPKIIPNERFVSRKHYWQHKNKV